MAADAKTVMELRERTGAGVMDCKAALQASDGNLDSAVEFLRKKGLADAKKREGRDAKDGLVHAYIHPGSKLGVLIEVNCETDFVAKTPEFQGLVKDIAMHIAALSPLFVTKDEVPAEVLEKEKEIYRAQAAAQGKPLNVQDKIAEGKLKDYYAQFCLLEQPFVKDPAITVQDLVSSYIAKLGENIRVRRFARFVLGESQDTPAS